MYWLPSETCKNELLADPRGGDTSLRISLVKMYIKNSSHFLVVYFKMPKAGKVSWPFSLIFLLFFHDTTCAKYLMVKGLSTTCCIESTISCTFTVKSTDCGMDVKGRNSHISQLLHKVRFASWGLKYDRRTILRHNEIRTNSMTFSNLFTAVVLQSATKWVETLGPKLGFFPFY